MGKTGIRWLHHKHGAYYLVRNNKWTRLSDNLHDALVEYARLTAGKDKGALPELVRRVLDDMEQDVAASTLKNYKTCARRVLDSFVEFSPAQIKPAHIAQFLDDHKSTPSMANLLRAFLKGMFSRAVRWGVVETNPVREIKPFKTGKRTRYITDDEFEKIREQASPTLQCLMDVAYITGQRIGDVMGIRYEDIVPAGARGAGTPAGVYVEQQKTKARVLIEITDDLQAALDTTRAVHCSPRAQTLFHKPDGSPLSYFTIYGHWRRACEDAKVGDAHIHDMRAKAATDAKAQGLDSKTLLGHTTDSSHNRYLRDKDVPVAKPVSARTKKK
ncbi:MAG: tyrosine-type recombinase/integrase [FCB group bacterium]|jgi:integrase|nr:tyrosine-type recombinase/integrase [FCB group bacterium]